MLLESNGEVHYELEKPDPLYEIYVQTLEPKQPEQEEILTYDHPLAKQYSRQKWKAKERNPHEPYSSSESDEDETSGQQAWAWDTEQLEKVQLDDFTVKRSYLKLTCQKSNDKQDQDHFLVHRDIILWPDPAVTYQYLLDCLVVRQKLNQRYNEAEVQEIALEIRKGVERFESEQTWQAHLKKHKIVEHFMAQDKQRWKNQDFACSVFFAGFRIAADRAGGERELEEGYVVEAVNVDKPGERAYLYVKSLAGMRGTALQAYIDEELRLEGRKKRRGRKGGAEAEQAGDADAVQRVYFARSAEEFLAEYKAELAAEAEEDEEAEQEEQAPVELPPHLSALSAAELRRAALTVQSWCRGVRARRQFSSQLGQGKVVSRFKLEGDKAQIYIFVQYFETFGYYRFFVFNLENKVRRDDIVYIKSLELPGGIAHHSACSQAELRKAFQDRLKVIWRDAKARPRLIQDAFIDNTITKVVEVRKEVPVAAPQQPAQIAEKKKKKKDSSSDSDESSDDDDDLGKQQVRDDVALLKGFVKTLRKQIAKLPQGVREWYSTFDADGSDRIELAEFLRMLEQLEIYVEQRVVTMLFQLFDRAGDGYFRYSNLADIIEGKMKPDYKRIVRTERRNWKKRVVERSSSSIVMQQADSGGEEPVEVIVKEVPRYVEKTVYVDRYEAAPVRTVQPAPAQPEPRPVAEKPAEVAVKTKLEPKKEFISQPVPRSETKPLPKPTPAPAKEEEKVVDEWDAASDQSFGSGEGDSDPWSQDNRNVQMKQDFQGVFNVHEGHTMMFTIFTGQAKLDKYFTLSTKAIGQNFKLYNKIKFSQSYVKYALLQKGTTPAKATSKQVSDILREQFQKSVSEIGKQVINPKKQPETWIPTLKAEIEASIGQARSFRETQEGRLKK